MIFLHNNVLTIFGTIIGEQLVDLRHDTEDPPLLLPADVDTRGFSQFETCGFCCDGFLERRRLVWREVGEEVGEAAHEVLQVVNRLAAARTVHIHGFGGS